MMFGIVSLVFSVFLGVIAGYALALIAPEELRPGYKNLVVFRNILFSAFAAVICFYYINGYINYFVFPLLIAVIMLYGLSKKDFFIYLYWLSSVSLAFLWQSKDYLMVVSVLLFLCGMCSASISAVSYVKDDNILKKKALLLKILKKHSLFVVSGLIAAALSSIF